MPMRPSQGGHASQRTEQDSNASNSNTTDDNSVSEIAQEPSSPTAMCSHHALNMLTFVCVYRVCSFPLVQDEPNFPTTTRQKRQTKQNPSPAYRW